MKVKLHIVLHSVTSTTAPRYQVTTELTLTKDNLGGVVDRNLTVKVGSNFYKITFLERDWDKINSVLNAHCRMRDQLCNGYLKQLDADGWEEIIPKQNRTAVITS